MSAWKGGHGVRLRPQTRTLEAAWRAKLGATVAVLERWDTMTAAARQPWRERERAALDAYISDIEAWLGC